jgi:hypothetical protein
VGVAARAGPGRATSRRLQAHTISCAWWHMVHGTWRRMVRGAAGKRFSMHTINQQATSDAWRERLHVLLCVLKCCVSGVCCCSPLGGLCWKCKHADMLMYMDKCMNG